MKRPHPRPNNSWSARLALCKKTRLVVLFLVTFPAFLPAQTQYAADGTPTGLEEEIRWRVNRGRYDSASENRLRGTAYSDIPASLGPLAPNQSLTVAARHQSEDMAKHNVFQHATVSGSAYYDPTTQPNPWDRMKAEGYSFNYAGENIAAGYGNADAAYVGWWNSAGHRANMFNGAFREIGDGYYYWSASTYRAYYTMDLANSGNHCFFTDTLFYDANRNGVYDQGEGIAGVTVSLLVDGVPFQSLDVSTAAGSFAIPIQTISNGAAVQVILSNSTAAAITLTLPRDYLNSTNITLAKGGTQVAGSFTPSANVRNFGFRDLSPAPTIVPARLVIASSAPGVCLVWPTKTGLEYQPQWTTNFTVWNNLSSGFLSGTGGSITNLDTTASGQPPRFYRLLIRAL